MTERIITDSNGRKHITNEPLLHDTTPPQREWVGLTHQERNAIRGKYWIAMSDDVFDDIEAKLNKKNT